MRRLVQGLVCLALIGGVGIVYVVSEARADTCSAGEYVCDTGSSVEGC